MYAIQPLPTGCFNGRFVRYIDEIVEPTVKDFENNPNSVRHAFLACVAVFHSVDYLAFPREPAQKFRQEFGKKSTVFKIVDDVAHAFKHVTAGNRKNPNLKAKEVISKEGGAFSNGFNDGFDIGKARVTFSADPSLNILDTVKSAVEFLRRQIK